MAGSILDMLATLTGHPDPSMRLAAALGQAPGQPGGAPAAPGMPPTGQPGSGPPAPPTGGPQAAAQGSPPGQAGAPQGQGGGQGINPSAPTMANGQPAPNAYASPSDLGSMYLEMAQRAQASNQFNNGLALMAASLYPGRRPDIIMNAARGMNQDPSELFDNLMKLQTYGQQQQNYQAMRAGVPQMLKDAGISQDYAPLVMAQPGLLGDILKVRMGVTGDPAERALQAARNDWLMRNPGKSENDMLSAHPEYSDPISYAATKTGEATTASAIAKDQATDRNSATKGLPALVTSTGDMLTNLDKIIGASDDDLGSYVGNPLAAVKPLTGAGASMTANPELAGALDQVVKQTFGEGFREVAGKTSRVTNTEATSLSGSLSQLQNRGLSPSAFRTQAQVVKDRLLHTLGTAYGEAGLSDNLPGYLQGNDSAGNPYLDSEYSPKGGRYWQSGSTAPPSGYPGLPSAAPKASPEKGGAGDGAASATAGGAPAGYPNAKKAPDGNWYVPDSSRPGKYLRVD